MKPVSLTLSFFLCVIISIFIVTHSYLFLREHIDPVIALLVSLVIEASYICYSILAVILGKWTRLDGLIKASLFFLSVIPATMQTSYDTRSLFSGKLSLIAPTAPQNIENLITSYDNQLIKIDDEISALRNFKGTYDINKSDRTWYAYQDQKRIDNLMITREKVDAQKKQIEMDYFNKREAYNQQNTEFLQQKSWFSFDVYFDLFFMLWTILVVWILQIVNGRLSSGISWHLANHTVAVEDSEQVLISPELTWLVSKYQPENVTLKELKKLLKSLTIHEYSELKTFLDTDYKKALNKKVPSKNRAAITKLFDSLKDEVQKSAEQSKTVAEPEKNLPLNSDKAENTLKPSQDILPA